jgi:serine/threonine-protein kinase
MADQRYTITERVDQGGMAEVFRGVAEGIKGFKKNVAIKRILPNLTKNKKFISMFLDEARLSLHLQHANIVHVFDIGVANDSYFIVMEYVDGLNLKGLIEHEKKRGRRMKVSHTLWLMAEVCKGLSYAHEAVDPEDNTPLGIVHRDISPPNILISKQAEVKLVDFGLAKATSQIEITDPGVVKGKFSYLSPEAASGVEVDHRADIFAVGILLWEMLAARRLFYGESDYQTVELVRQARVPSLRAVNPEVDADLEAVVMKALARDPRDRYQLAGDLQEALAQYLFAHGLKVTNQDLRTLVLEAVADRDKDKPRATGSGGKQLIDQLIFEEMQKFTSLDEVSDVTPEPVAPDSSTALDPGSFVDTSNWADEVDVTAGRQAAATQAARQAQAQPRHQRPATAATAPRRQTRVPTGEAELPEIDSLQQFLEPDRQGQVPPAATQRIPAAGSKTTMLLVAVIVLLVVVGGGLIVFRDKIFGGGKPGAAVPSGTH